MIWNLVLLCYMYTWPYTYQLLNFLYVIFDPYSLYSNLDTSIDGKLGSPAKDLPPDHG